MKSQAKEAGDAKTARYMYTIKLLLQYMESDNGWVWNANKWQG